MNKNVFLTIILVAVSLVIAALLFVRFNPAEHRLSETDISMLAQQIVRGEDHVTVHELSDRIIKARGDYLLIDIRTREEYEERHIESAVHMPLGELVKTEVLNDLPEDRAVIVYSNSTTNAAQAAVMLRMSGISAYSLIGGYNHWSAWMTDPAAAGIAEHDVRQRAKYDAIRCYLEGEYVAGAGLPPAQAESAGFTPPLTPVGESTDSGDPLGLGLGLGLEAAGEAPSTPGGDAAGVEDPLGLGLGLGETAPAEDPGPVGGGAPAGLLIGEGC